MQFSFWKKVLLLGTLGFLVYFFIGKKEKPKASELIQRVINYSKFLDETVLEIEKHLEEDPFDKLVAEKVKPAAYRLASVRKQIEIYEKMDRTHGIPYEFMNKSMIIVEETAKELDGWEKEYRLSLKRIQRTWPRIFEKVQECREELGFIDKDESFEVLNAFQIHFQPMDYEDPVFVRKQKYAKTNPMSLQDILQVVEYELLPLIIKFEKIKISDNQSPQLDRTTDIVNLKLLETLQELMEHLGIYGAYYETVGKYWLDTFAEIDKKCSRAAEVIGESSKRRYEDIASGIDIEIAVLREKIKNLKYPKTKKSPDEL